MKIKDFVPLLSIIGLVLLFTGVMQYRYGFSWESGMLDFMGAFFLIFGLFKIINLKEFAQAYRMYDLPSRYIPGYAWVYPFGELALGVCYLMRYQLFAANIITVLLMFIGSVGVLKALQKKETLVCACLGALFKIPMTYVTLAEDVVMGLMALMMLLIGMY